MALKRGRYSVTVGTDNYYLQYRVMIGAHNNKGHGPNSTEQIIYSAEGSKSYSLRLIKMID
jgi:hypothetical protein